ncbi:MAG: bifunctional DNA primase/polymerase [Tateyamaria sp.]|uniref:bifunctional DNA primase/polymerase n=1 Tax=Tateyamaria sp. TaxID=1929288 RepID=UPI00329EA759
MSDGTDARDGATSFDVFEEELKSAEMNSATPIETETATGANKAIALEYAANGFPVFPCLEADGLAVDAKGRPKKAKAPYTSSGFRDASANAQTVKEWWSDWPDALVGLPTGAASGIAVIDVDTCKETGEAVGEKQAQQAGLTVLGALSVATPSGGRHDIYRHVEGAKSSAKQIAEYVDVRAEGGYIIAPGTKMPDGTAYIAQGGDLIADIARLSPRTLTMHVGAAPCVAPVASIAS